MRSANIVRALSVTAAAVALIVACGSEDSSTFVDPNALDEAGASSSSSSGGFNNVDSGPIEAGVDPNCKPLTCAEQGIECGAAGDGCGGLIADCGKCTDGKRCGGPGALSKCVDPKVGSTCVPKTCAEQGIECGPAGDGCGGIIPDCGKCTAPGTQCGDNNTPSKCVTAGPLGPDGGACVPRDCSYYTALGFNCGKQSDGCGGELTCGTCTVQGEFCGGGGPNVCGNPVNCVKKTCADYPVGTCGQQSDDCGGLTVNCGLCTVPGEICGGGGVPSKCGGGAVLGPDGGACIPKTVCGANECGDVADGCGGILSCGTGNCTGTTICGGAGVPNQCGTPNCVKNPATQAAACAGKNCGVVSDGCGGTWICGGANACTPPAICGGGGVANVCGGGTVTGPDGGTCTPKTAASCTTGQCGSFPNGCGGLYDCGGCAPGTGECGGDPLKGPGVCGGGTQCTPLSKAAACGSMTCGYAPDGCGPTSSNGNGGYWACGSLNGACPTGQSCGIFAPNQCGSLTGPCINDTTTSCTSNTQCCSGLCGALGKCVAAPTDGGVPTCGNLGASCINGNQCCSGKCTGNVCVTNGAPGNCKSAGSTCSSDSECCSKGCIGGKCSLATSFCKQTGEACTSGSQCCGGACSGAIAGTQAGFCITTDPAGGQDSCIVAGTVVNCSTTSPSSYVCNADCCSGSCSGNDSVTGHAICQLSPGCRVLGELCTNDSQCCNDGTNKSSKCNTQNNQPPSATNIGRCNSEQACNKPGQVCKTATDSCSFSNNCCIPSDLVGVLNNCSSDPSKCCRHDNQGVPRCTGFGVCRNPGQTCTGSQDCCPLTPGGDPPPCSNGICQAESCISDETKPCTVDKDCCNGNCFKQNPTDFTGLCKIPTCTKKTCDDYPGKCGYQSDGCGDIIRDTNGNPKDCNPCTPPQTCGGGAGGQPSVCGGSICTPLQACPAGFECGQYPDGCGGLLNCGTCPKAGGDPADTCGGGGQANKCGHPTCTPKTCAEQGIQCGQTGNGCGQVINCPPCDPGLTCGGGGTPNKCGAPACTPKTCAQLGIECGDAPNGCGGTTTCPPCPDPTETCGGGGAPNICGKATCTAKTCAQQYPTGIKNCGDISNLCGGTTNCGMCPPGQSCVDNECIGTACVPKTCMQLGVECGQVADGCGGLTPECGPCPAGTGCGAGGTPNKCDPAPCTPKTCQDLGAVCGQIANGCGGLTPSCGDCGGNLACKNGACVQACTPRTCTEADAQCGYVADGCGGVVDCGLCPDGFTCGYNGQANKCGRSQPN